MRNIVLAVAALTLSGMARAEEPAKPKVLRVSLGTYRANDGGSRTALNFSYDLPAMKGKENSSLIYNAYLDTNSHKTGGVTHSLTGIGLGVRRAPVATGGFYPGAGIGLYSIKAGATRSRLGGKVLYGYERKEGIFAEASYNFVPKVSGYDASGTAFAVGYRF